MDEIENEPYSNANNTGCRLQLPWMEECQHVRCWETGGWQVELQGVKYLEVPNASLQAFSQAKLVRQKSRDVEEP
jgi:hypothetical protein